MADGEMTRTPREYSLNLHDGRHASLRESRGVHLHRSWTKANTQMLAIWLGTHDAVGPGFYAAQTAN